MGGGCVRLFWASRAPSIFIGGRPQQRGPAWRRQSAPSPGPDRPSAPARLLPTAVSPDPLRPSLALVVPCFNEQLRLDSDAFASYLSAAAPRVRLIFVDDGSNDGSIAVLERLVSRCGPSAELLALGTNQGKAEAVRRGMLHALESHPYRAVGFWDSDLATPLSAVAQLEAVLVDHPGVQMVFGARVALLGRKIHRSLRRHYAGRVFATLTSLVLDLPIYDTQCGAKLFRVTPVLRTVLTQPFVTRWVFDVEMIARFAALCRPAEAPKADATSHGGDAASGGDGAGGTAPRRGGALPTAAAPIPPMLESIFEFPLHEWVDVAGSKLRGADVLKMAAGLGLIYGRYSLHEWPSGAPRLKAQARARRAAAAAAAVAVVLLAVLMTLVVRIRG